MGTILLVAGSLWAVLLILILGSYTKYWCILAAKFKEREDSRLD